MNDILSSSKTGKVHTKEKTRIYYQCQVQELIKFVHQLSRYSINNIVLKPNNTLVLMCFLGASSIAFFFFRAIFNMTE